MENISRVASLIQLYVVSFTGIICIGVFGGIVAASLGANGCAPQTDKFDLYSLIWLGLGLIMLGWLVKGILFPKLRKELWGRSRAIESAAGNDNSYDFCPTHPSYVLLDILLIPPFYLIYSMTANDSRCVFLPEYYRGSIVLILAFALPIFRLFSWYVLRRQMTSEVDRKSAPKALIPLYLIITPLLIILAVSYIQMVTFPQMRAPSADGKTFVGGLNEHPELRERIVYLKGIQKSEPFECNKFNGEFACATVLVDVGEGGEVLVKLCGIGQQNLIKQTKGNIGKPFETFGKIVPIDAKQKDLCGLEALGNPPPAGRYLLDVEYP